MGQRTVTDANTGLYSAPWRTVTVCTAVDAEIHSRPTLAGKSGLGRQVGTTLTPKTHNDARSLFVLSKDRDYEQLGLARSLLRGQEFANGTRMLLPEHLYAQNSATLPFPAAVYANLRDILDTVDAHEPDLVFLFSGYLLSADRLLSRQSLDALLRQLRDRGCHVITSDPFLGLAPQLTLAQVDTWMGMASQTVWTRWRRRLMMRLLDRRTKVFRVPSLEDAIHLYPTSIPDLDEGIRGATFFNPAVPRAAADPGDASPASEQDEPQDAPSWLFVLSATDVDCQCLLVGLREFTELLLGVLRYAVEVGRRPTLIARPGEYRAGSVPTHRSSAGAGSCR